jgi:hypothetical protein
MLRIRAPKFEEVSRGWKKVHNQEVHNLYVSPDIIKMIKSRRMRWTGHFAHMGKQRNAHKDLVGIPKGKTPLDGKIILK